MISTWEFAQTDPERVQRLARELNLPIPIATILLNRRFEDHAEINRFFNPSLDNLYDPFLMTDMDKSVDRIIEAIHNDDSIVVFGDYDVDGTTATSLLHLFFRDLGIFTHYYIPDREKEGYGLSITGIDFALARGARLLITCDCGISAYNEIEYANRHGLEVIVTDHHEPGERLPDAYAILDPKRSDDTYPFKELCGAGVAFKLLEGICRRLQLPLTHLFEHLDLVSIGTAADIVPILDENRILVAYGLQQLNRSTKPGVQALLKIAGFANKTINVVNIIFGLAPRLNAAGRLGEASRSVRLLTTTDVHESTDLSFILDKVNRERQNIERQTIDSAILQLNATHDLEKDKVIILADSEWHSGVIGIVASKLKEMYNRPVVMVAFQDSIGKGSARSIPGFDLYAAFNECAEYLLNFGGHKMAAGLSVSRDQLPAFRNRLQGIAAAKISDRMLRTGIEIECEITLEDINQNTIDYLRRMAPFGPGNMRPTFIARNLFISGIPRIIGENHLKFRVTQNKLVVSAIGWKLGSLYEMLISNRPLDMAFVVEENEWNGIKEIQLNVKDIDYSTQ